MTEDNEITLSKEHEKTVKEWQLNGQTVMFLVIDNKIEGIISVADTIKPGSAKAIKTLQKMGIMVYMLTGDNKFTAKADDWELFFSELCVSKEQANGIERHIKKMKSKIYINNLIKYPDIILKLKECQVHF